MKRIFLVALSALFLVMGAAWATITLSPGEVQSFSTGGTVTETDNVASATGVNVSFPAQTITITVQYGAPGPNGFAPGAKAQPLTVTINARNGQVAVSDGRPNIRLTSAQLSALVTNLKNDQNQIESTLLSLGVLSGTQVAN